MTDMLSRRRLLIGSAGLASLALFSSAGPAMAAFSTAQIAILNKINSYFNQIRTMQGRFIQFGPNGEQSEGVFFIYKPGRIRFHYSPPVKMDIIADGSQVAVRDSKVMTQDLYPLNKTPLRYLLADQIDLTSSNIVRQMIQEPDLISLVLRQDSAFSDGSLKLIFDNKSFELRQWVVTDSQGLDTSVAVYDVDIGHAPDPTNFKINYYLPKSK